MLEDTPVSFKSILTVPPVEGLLGFVGVNSVTFGFPVIPKPVTKPPTGIPPCILLTVNSETPPTVLLFVTVKNPAELFISETGIVSTTLTARS